MLCPEETRGQGKGWEVAGTSCVREADALVPSCPGPGKGHIWVVFPGRREAVHVVTAEQGFPTGAHEPVLWNCKGRQEKQRYCHGLHRGLEPPWGKHSKDEHICSGLAGAKSSWFLSFLPLHRWKAVLPPYLWVQEPGLQVH